MIFGTHGWCDNEGRQVDSAERGNYIVPQSGVAGRTVGEGDFKDGHIEVRVIQEVAIPKLAHATDEKRLAPIWSVRKL